MCAGSNNLSHCYQNNAKFDLLPNSSSPQSISKEPHSPNNESKLPHNITKNRFGNVFPCEYVRLRFTTIILCLFCVIDDFNRVKLKPVKDVIGSDYINASYVYVSQFISLIVARFHTSILAGIYG